MTFSGPVDEAWRDREIGPADIVRSVFDAMPLAMLGMEGPEHRLVAVNEAYRAMVRRSALVGRAMAELYPEVAGQQLFEMYDRVYQTGQPVIAQEWHVQADLEGTGVISDAYFDFTVTPRLSADGSVMGTTLIVAEVSERVRARQATDRQVAAAERRYTRARDLITALQRELLPAGLPVLPRLRIAASYLPAEADTSAGGDWFDAIPLADGRVALVVGDVVGHGVAASATMGQLRAVLHDRLAEGDVSAALAALDRASSRLPGAHAATVCVAVIDPATGSICYCTAGHPPPLILTASGETRYLSPTGAGPLGSGLPFATGRDQLAEGGVLLLYTDGIIERPGRDHAASVIDLARVAADAVADRIIRGTGLSAVERMCTQALELLVRPAGHSDDITMLAAQWCAPPAPLRLDLAADPLAIATAHRALADWLHELEVGRADLTAMQHAVGELVTNSVEHAFVDAPAPGRVRVDADLAPDGSARVLVSDGGRWREPRPDAGNSPRGLGLVLAERLVHHLHVERTDAGTTATITHAVTRPGRLMTEDEIRSSVPEPGRRIDPDLLLILDQPEAPDAPDAPHARVRVDGPITATTAGQLARQLQRLTRNGTRPLVVDLTGATVLFSAGVAALQHAAARSRDHGAQLRLVAPAGSPAQHVLTLVGLPHDTVDPQDSSDPTDGPEAA